MLALYGLRYSAVKRFAKDKFEMAQAGIMETNLKGKHALVTGSTSGIGLGIASELARNGCDVVLSGFGDAAAIGNLKARLHDEYGVRAIHVDADVANPQQCRDLVA